MKVKVLSKFKDAETKEIRNKGDIFECSEERYKRIVAVGKYVEPVDNPVGDIAQMNIKELKELAKEKGIENYAKLSKEELLDALK